MNLLRAALAVLLLTPGACAKEPEPVLPALWEVSGPKGERGWLLGTVHALPEPVDWRSPAVNAALRGSDRLVLEIANSGDAASLGKVFSRLASSPGLPPVLVRVPAQRRAALAAALEEHGLDPRELARLETWAVALTLSRNASREAEGRFGMEQELTRAAQGKAVVPLTTAEAQLRQFDGLPADEQLDLLAAIVTETSAQNPESRLAKAWAEGDLATLEAETMRGLLADPELREALMLAPNRDWAEKVDALLATGKRPLVAVGAAHMLGPEGLPGLLAARGYSVRRLQ